MAEFNGTVNTYRMASQSEKRMASFISSLLNSVLAFFFFLGTSFALEGPDFEAPDAWRVNVVDSN